MICFTIVQDPRIPSSVVVQADQFDFAAAGQTVLHVGQDRTAGGTPEDLEELGGPLLEDKVSYLCSMPSCLHVFVLG